MQVRAKRSTTGPYIAGLKKNPMHVIIGKSRRKAVAATRAKVLTRQQLEVVLDHVQSGSNPERDTVLVLLSFGCGLRAQEIAGIKWKRNVLDAEGKIADMVHVTRDIGKRTEERVIPLHPDLKVALRKLRQLRQHDVHVVYSLKKPYKTSERAKNLNRGECDANTIVQYLRRLYAVCGFEGCTSHSGRRTFITNAARRCNEAGASIRDVQTMAGHKSLETTAMYIEASDQQKRLVSMVL